MSSQSSSKSVLSLIGNIGWPVVLGTSIAGVFLALVLNGPLANPFTLRYFAGHPISMTETALFFAGLVALALKGMEILGEYNQIERVTLGERGEALDAHEATHLLDRLSELTTAAQRSYLGRRLADALTSIVRSGSTDRLDEELKYLSEGDTIRQQDSYSLVRIIVWATPMLGFLGTVIGITAALGNLDPKQLATAPDVAFEGLKNGLYTAFDSTAVALSFSMLLMFLQYFADRLESHLLSVVDSRASDELADRFTQVGSATDPHVRTIERMGVAVVRATEGLVEKQAEVWQSSLQHAQERWQQTSQTAGTTLTTALAAALTKALGEHIDQLSQVEHKANEQMQRRWEQWQTALSDNARLLHAHQQELIRQSELMSQAIGAVGNVVQLETALNDNLNMLAGSKNFEETVLSLSAAINLLNNRLGSPSTERVDLSKTSSGKGKAA